MILSGPLKARFTHLKNGLRISRKDADLKIPDPKISQIHGIIEENESGEFLLKDLDSANGIFVDGIKIKSLLLKPGVLFRLGNTELEVGTLSKDGKKFISGTEDPIAPKPKLLWRDFFIEFCESGNKSKNALKKLMPFPQLVELKFLRGPLIQKRYHLAYGPRIFGAQSLDFPLYSEKLPDDFFSIGIKNHKIFIKTVYPSLLRLNNNSIMSANLKTGDLLEFLDHRALVHMKALSD